MFTLILRDRRSASPFFSPDGQWIGFFAAAKLKKIAINGGSVQTLCNAPGGMGGAWGPDNTIYFAPYNTSGLLKVSASGGTPHQLTRLDRAKGEISHRWPQTLPGGKALLFEIWTGFGWDSRAAALYSLESGEQRILVRGASSGRYVPTGHLVYSYAGRLMAVKFDLAALGVLEGPAVPLDEEVMSGGEGMEWALSDAGTLAYIPPGEKRDARQLFWVDRSGKEEPLAAPPRDYRSVRLSPDGKRIAADVWGSSVDVWIYDLGRSALTRLTSEEGGSQFPVWTPDGKQVVYRGTRSGFRNLYWKPVDGSGAEERLTEGEDWQSPSCVSPDGKCIIYVQEDEKTGADIWMMPLDGDRKSKVLLTSEYSEGAGRLSPDGRWLAYTSNQSGRPEVYVQPFPGPGGRLQVSTEGGGGPMWNQNGRELFYRNGNKMMSVSVSLQQVPAAASPKLLFQVSSSGYDVSADGSRFLMIKAMNAKEWSANQIQVVLNWFEELKRKVSMERK